MSVVPFKKEYKFNVEGGEDICDALAARGLNVVGGRLRFNIFLQNGGTALLIDAKKSWEVSVKDGEMTVVVSTDRQPSKPGVMAVLVKADPNAMKDASVKEPSWNVNPKDITPSRFKPRTVQEDDSPSP